MLDLIRRSLCRSEPSSYALVDISVDLAAKDEQFKHLALIAKGVIEQLLSLAFSPLSSP